VLLVVNGSEVTVEDGLRSALLDGGPSGLLAGLIDREILRQHATARGIVVPAEDLQTAIDELRYDRGLESASRAERWLLAHHQTLESIARHVEDLLIRRAVTAAIPDAHVQSYYAAHRPDLEFVVLFSIRVATEHAAAAVRERLDRGESFPVVAASVSEDEATRAAGGALGRLHRADLEEEIAGAVFGALAGALVGPLRTPNGYNVFLVADRRVPSLEEAAPAIRGILLEALMRDLRARAEIAYPPLLARGEQ
jgi:hypothetical protein